MRWTVLHWLGLIMFGLGPRQILAISSQSTGMRDSLSTITTDTGAFRPGHTSFTRYTTPALCREAALNASAMLRRTLAAQAAMDSLRKDPMHDTLPAAVGRIARACGAQFTVQGTAVADLPDLFELALLEQDDSLAQAVLARQVATASGDTMRVQILQDAITKYLAAEPARVMGVTRILTQLDALGPVALSARIAAHARLLAFGGLTQDQVRIQREADTIITLLRPLGGATLALYSSQLVNAYSALMGLAFLHAPDSIPTVVRRAHSDLSRVPFFVSASGQKFSNPFSGASRDSTSILLSPIGDWRRVGRPAPRLHADFWFPAGADTVQPAHGTVSVFVEVPAVCYERDDWVLDGVCHDLYTTIRQWQARYDASSLKITLVASAKWHSLLSGPQAPAEVAANLQWFFLQYLGLPVQLAVQVVPHATPLPIPDRRIFVLDTYAANTPFDLVYKSGRGDPTVFPVVLIGRDGLELYAGGISPLFERLLVRAMTPSAAEQR